MILFADDIAIIAKNERKLQSILVQMEEVMAYFSMKINRQKIKAMKCSMVEK